MVAKRTKQQSISGVRKNSTIDTIKRITVNQMKSLGVYRPEYDTLISMFADTVYEYNRCLRQFNEEGSRYEVETEKGGTKKSGTASALETLRKEIASFSDRLMLNPRSHVDKNSTPNQTAQNFDTEDLLKALDEKLST